MFDPYPTDEARSLFDGIPRENARSRRFVGTRDGVPLTIAFLRPDGSNGEPGATQVHVERDTDEVLLRLTFERAGIQAKVSEGKYVDVVIGDASFDSKLLIEGAPADVVRALFDEAPALRRRLIDELPSLTSLSVDTGGISISLHEYPETELRPAVEVVLELTRGIERAAARLRGGTFRTSPRAREHVDAQEMEGLRDLWYRRDSAKLRRSCLATFLVLAAFFGYVAYRMMSS